LLRKFDINGNPYIGVYCHVNEEFAIVPPEFTKDMISQIEEGLDVEVVQTTIANSSIIGVLVCSNSYGMVVTNFAEDRELKAFKERLNILYIRDVLNACADGGRAIFYTYHDVLEHNGYSWVGKFPGMAELPIKRKDYPWVSFGIYDK